MFEEIIAIAFLHLNVVVGEGEMLFLVNLCAFTLAEYLI